MQVGFTQLQRLNQVRAEFHDAFPEMGRAKDLLHKILDEVHKTPDGSVDARRLKVLQDIHDKASDLLLALLFSSA
jgi:hypothetical protein